MNDLPSSYASALFSLLKTLEEKQAYADALKALDELLKEEKDVLTFLSSPDFGQKEKIDVLSKSLNSYKGLTHLIPFLATIISHHRMPYFSTIVAAFVSLVNDEAGILEGYVYSSEKLSKDQLESLQNGFYKKLGKKVLLKNILDPSLIGGVRVSLDGKVYDSSLKGKLEQLRHHLNQGGSSL